jgi:hypothetical protein
METVSEWLRASRRSITWLYCSAILCPLVFAFVAAVVLTARHAGTDPLAHRFFTIFYLALMITLASVPRSILPILLLWMVLIRFRPSFDANKVVRYLGFLLLMMVTVYTHSKAYGREFNWQWLAIGWLSLSLPRIALHSLRGGLRETAV